MEDLKAVKFLSAVRVFPDGIHPVTANVGQVLSLSNILADGLIRDNLAELVDISKIKSEVKQEEVKQEEVKQEEVKQEEVKQEAQVRSNQKR